MSSLLKSLANSQIFIANKEAIYFIEICINAAIKIRHIIIYTSLLVIDKLAQLCILREPYACYASLQIDCFFSSQIKCIIQNKDKESSIYFNAALGIEQLLQNAAFSNNIIINNLAKKEQAGQLLVLCLSYLQVISQN